jgi:hypothetical protein
MLVTALPLFGILYLDSNDTAVLNDTGLNMTPSPELPNQTAPALNETTIEDVKYEHGPARLGERVVWKRVMNVRGWKDYKVDLNLPPDYENLEIVDLAGNYTFENGSLILFGNHTLEISFTTSAPEKTEELLSDKPYQKKVTVYSDTTLHYNNIPVSTTIPEGLNLTIIELPDKQMGSDPAYNVTFLDTDGNGLSDMISWIVPQLSTEEYLIQEAGGIGPLGMSLIGAGKTELFYDGFETGMGAWTVTGEWRQNNTSPSNGTYSAYYNNNASAQYMNHTQSTVGYMYINVSFNAIAASNDAGEFLNFSYWNGTGWVRLLSVEDIASWTYYSYLLPAAADELSTFAISFNAKDNAANEWYKVDNVRIMGILKGTISEVDIGNVSNIYRGDRETDIFCNATSITGWAVANVSLQYDNGTIGGWINLNQSNKAPNVSELTQYGEKTYQPQEQSTDSPSMAISQETTTSGAM